LTKQILKVCNKVAKYSLLLVEDSKSFASMLQQKIQNQLDITVDWAATMKEAAQKIEAAQNPFSLALLDLGLPDAPNGEIVDFVLDQNIPP
jgi:DNA-binding response OmpR family regulator